MRKLRQLSVLTGGAIHERGRSMMVVPTATLQSAKTKGLLCGHKGIKRVLYPAGASSVHLAVRMLDLLGQDFGKARQDQEEALAARVVAGMPVPFLQRSLSRRSCQALVGAHNRNSTSP